jgi:hypothetical protein
MKLFTIKSGLIVLILAGITANSNCLFELYKKRAVQILKGYIYLKTFTLDGSDNSEEIEHSYVFTRGTTYKLVLQENQDVNDIKMTIYDGYRNEIANNYDKTNKTYYSGMLYSCSATGVHFISYSFKESKVKCAVSVIGFKK